MKTNTQNRSKIDIIKNQTFNQQSNIYHTTQSLSWFKQN